jgi:hypothetical protein
MADNPLLMVYWTGYCDTQTNQNEATVLVLLVYSGRYLTVWLWTCFSCLINPSAEGTGTNYVTLLALLIYVRQQPKYL